jgi:hypothetical protein
VFFVVNAMSAKVMFSLVVIMFINIFAILNLHIAPQPVSPPHCLPVPHCPENSTKAPPVSSANPNYQTSVELNHTGSEETSKLPSFSLVTRMWHGHAQDYFMTFALSHSLFWPKTYTNSNVVVVLDDESDDDHYIGTLIANVPPFPSIVFETHPGKGVLCSDWRNEGYSRQQYSNFFGDLQSNASFIGIVDSDAMFATPITPNMLFRYDHVSKTHKPVMYAYDNPTATGWCGQLTKVAVGGECVGEFMVVIGFPVMVKREHFASMRNMFISNLGKRNFNEVFHALCTDSGGQHYSQFDLIGNYLWHHHRADYDWHIRGTEQAGHPGLYAISTDKISAEVRATDIPMIGRMKHNFKGYPAFTKFFCVGTNWMAGECLRFRNEQTEQFVRYNLAADWYEENGLGPEQPWTIPNRTWDEVMSEHSKDVLDHQYMFQWRGAEAIRVVYSSVMYR